MAIDTAEKRRSAAGAGVVALLPGVTPNVSKPVAWRQQSAWGYSGIVTAAASEPEIYQTWTEIKRGVVWTEIERGTTWEE